MVRVCVCKPPPHGSEHTDQDDHSLTAQSTGHNWVLQVWDCVNDGHTLPPYAACCVTVRVWIWVPPPHVVEHVDHADQSLTRQSLGHSPTLHTCEVLGTGVLHVAPDGHVTVRVCTPPSQALEQADHSPTAYATSQACMLHSCD